ncbi:MAG: ATP-binding protein [Ruminococcus sp.]|nr:ATP-binding protein [Ruminococcus sp.]
MEDLKQFLMQSDTLVIFRRLREDTVISALLDTLDHIDSGRNEDALRSYGKLLSALYPTTEDLTEYITKAILEDENLYVLRKGEGKKTGLKLEACLACELAFFEELAKTPCSFITGRLDYDGFLPEYDIDEDADLSKIYADRLHAISEIGYGVYSKFHVFMVENGRLKPVEYPDSIRLSQLHGYENERERVIANTLALLDGKPANNVLLYGDCGTGKSSTVKAIANEYASRGLRLIELKKKQLHEIPSIVETISRNPLKFIVFIDDLSFTEDDNDYAALKAILEGSVASTASNLAIYATSNRRHLVRETFTSRKGDEIHFRDTVQELLSLSDRFGLTVTFQQPDKKLYLDLVDRLAEDYGVDIPLPELEAKAESFALRRGGRSPRTAKQFIELIKGSVNC